MVMWDLILELHSRLYIFNKDIWILHWVMISSKIVSCFSNYLCVHCYDLDLPSVFSILKNFFACSSCAATGHLGERGDAYFMSRSRKIHVKNYSSAQVRFCVCGTWIASHQGGWRQAYASSGISETATSSFWVAAHALSQGSWIYTEECTNCPLLHTRAHGWPRFPSVLFDTDLRTKWHKMQCLQ